MCSISLFFTWLKNKSNILGTFSCGAKDICLWTMTFLTLWFGFPEAQDASQFNSLHEAYCVGK